MSKITGNIKEYLREIMYGGSDGIVSTFAVVAGFSGASTSSTNPEITITAVLLFGFANLFADATSIGLGDFLSSRAEYVVYRDNRRKIRKLIKTNQEKLALDTVKLIKDKDIVNDEDIDDFLKILSRNPRVWVDWLIKYKYQLPDPTGTSIAISAITTFLSFIAFGFIPLVPYLFIDSLGENLFLVSIFTTMVALLLLGIIRWKIANLSLFRSILEVMLLGGVSAVIAFIVGTFFSL